MLCSCLLHVVISSCRYMLEATIRVITSLMSLSISVWWWGSLHLRVSVNWFLKYSVCCLKQSFICCCPCSCIQVKACFRADRMSLLVCLETSCLMEGKDCRWCSWWADVSLSWKEHSWLVGRGGSCNFTSWSAEGSPSQEESSQSSNSAMPVYCLLKLRLCWINIVFVQLSMCFWD